MNLKPKDHEKILNIIKKSNVAREISRAHTLNLRSKGFSPIEVADILEISSRTVYNIEAYYEEGGLNSALYDEARPGTPPIFDNNVKNQIVALVCSDPPDAFDHWTLDLLTEEAVKSKIVDSISRSTISLILREHDIKPWKQKMWCVPDLNEEFLTRMNDVLEVYERAEDEQLPVVCLDEKPIQLIEDKRPASGVVPRKVKKVDYEYKRNGTANVFCAVNPKSGKYFNRVTENRTGKEFAKFLRSIEQYYKSAKKIVLVMDNLNTHKKKSLIDFYGAHEAARIWDRFEVHYTPKHGSWLNQAEIAINMYSRQCLGKTRIPDIELLRKKTNAWNRVANRNALKIQWRFTKQDAAEKFGLN